jgi:predicted nucleic acid-binding protein
MIASLQLEVDEGEAEAIALAFELNADLLLIDERIGRAVASRLGIRFIGLLGVLIEARHKGLILAVKPVLDELIAGAGFWVTRELYDSVLRAAGE